ncbi:MAG: hypothetical protein R2941_02745 [Desulfobacterales bacterium]
MTEFADKTGLRIRLIYYPRTIANIILLNDAAGILEEHWDKEDLPDSAEKTVNWAAAIMNMKGKTCRLFVGKAV